MNLINIMVKIFRILLPGKPNSSDLRDYIIDGNYPVPKIDTTASLPHAGTITLNWTDATLVVAENEIKRLYSFSHNYPYIPTVFANYEYYETLSPANVSTGTMPFYFGDIGRVVIDSDSSNINIKIFCSQVGGSTFPAFVMKIRFYVMAERGY